MPVIKNKKTKKALVVKAYSKKNTAAYYLCMSECCKGKISPKKISQVAHECKNNALAINAKLSHQKLKAVNKIKKGYHQLGQGLDEFMRSK
jgi:hypothetical protein